MSLKHIRCKLASTYHDRVYYVITVVLQSLDRLGSGYIGLGHDKFNVLVLNTLKLKKYKNFSFYNFNLKFFFPIFKIYFCKFLPLRRPPRHHLLQEWQVGEQQHLQIRKNNF